MGASREHRQRLYEQLVGQTIAGRFEITNLLGFGGMGAVYQALQRNMQRDVALKVIPSHDPTTTARFEREALTISKLHHPNTVTVFDYGQTDQGLLFLAMEMLSGHTLSDLIENHGPLTPNRAVHIASQVCRSLYEAHQENIVHRDIKPDNIFLIGVDDDQDFVKVLDFGIAKIVRGEDNVELTGTGRIIGTPKYMSPEQILAEAVDHRSDIYSLACIVFEMLCGSPPFQDSSTTKLMLAHAHQAPPTFSERLTNQALARIPGPLEQVVRRALSKSPMERHRTIDEFRIDLEHALEATDHELRISELQSVSETQMAPGVTQRGAKPELTDSSDLLAQHSSQTLAKLKPPTGVLDSPTAEVADDKSSKDAPKKGSKTPVYAVAAALLLVGGLAAYMTLEPGDGPADMPQEPGPAENVVVAEEPEEAEQAPAEQALQQQAPAKQAPETKQAPALVEVHVTSEPEGARVHQDNRYIGKTPLTIEAEASSTLTYNFSREGFVAKDASFLVDPEDEAPTFVVELEEKKTKTNKRVRRPERRRPQTGAKAAASKPTKEDSEEPSEDKEESKRPSINIEMLADDEQTERDPKVDRLD